MALPIGVYAVSSEYTPITKKKKRKEKEKKKLDGDLDHKKAESVISEYIQA